MRERPILFSAPMVLALLDGWKTQTRRVMKPQPDDPYNELRSGGSAWALAGPCPYGEPGDRLWVKETWCAPPSCDHLAPRTLPNTTSIRYAADGVVRGVSKRFVDDDGRVVLGRARPSIFMHRWMSRVTLEVTGVRVERLQAISEADAAAEGAVAARQEAEDKGLTTTDDFPSARRAFRRLWESINGAESWSANPWVWVVEFKRVTP